MENTDAVVWVIDSNDIVGGYGSKDDGHFDTSIQQVKFFCIFLTYILCN